MKKNSLFEKCLANVNPETQAKVNLNIDIANRIDDLLKAKKMTQREFASLMGKKESEISRWLSGSHGFTTQTLAKIQTVLGEPVISVPKKDSFDKIQYCQFFSFHPCKKEKDTCTYEPQSRCNLKYAN